jgi:hypothetical protein
MNSQKFSFGQPIQPGSQGVLEGVTFPAETVIRGSAENPCFPKISSVGQRGFYHTKRTYFQKGKPSLIESSTVGYSSATRPRSETRDSRGPVTQTSSG